MMTETADYEIIDREMGITIRIAPWALPKEPIPLYVMWSPSLQFHKILVRIPKGFDIAELLNVESHDIYKDKEGSTMVEISEVKTTRRENIPHFFGLVIHLNEDPAKIVNITYIRKVDVAFLDEAGNAIRCFSVFARIFRPLIEVINAPKIIEVERDEIKIPLHLKYIGFGDILLEIKGEIGGELLSKGDAIAYEVIRRLLQQGIEETRRVKGVSEIHVSPKFVKELTKKVWEILKERRLPPTLLRTDKEIEILDEITSYIEKNYEEFAEMMYSRISEMLVTLLLDLLKRHPVDTVSLADSETNFLTKIEAPITDIKLIIKYKDKRNNEYEVTHNIQIVDKREVRKGIPPILIKVTIDKWDFEPLRNVKDRVFGREAL